VSTAVIVSLTAARVRAGVVNSVSRTQPGKNISDIRVNITIFLEG